MNGFQSLRNVDNYGMNTPLMGDMGSLNVPLIDAQSMAGWGASPASTLTALPAMTKGPMGMGDYMGAAGDWFSNSGFLGKTNADGSKTGGWGMPVISGLSSLASAYMGMKQLGLQRDAFNQSKKEFDMNWGAQQKTVNAQLEDRQKARVASNPGAYQSVDAYMKEKGI